MPFKGTVVIRQFPVQGVCWYMDTWGAPRSVAARHEGVDILAPQGKNVYAVDAGTLTKQYVDRPGALAGNGWRLTRADGTYFFYGHFSGFAAGLKVGSKVAAGQIIGYVGETGNAGHPTCTSRCTRAAARPSTRRRWCVRSTGAHDVGRCSPARPAA